MLVAGLAIWTVFCLRDYFLLQSYRGEDSGRRVFSRAVIWYAAISVGVSLLLGWALIARGIYYVHDLVFSARFLAIAAVLHVAGALAPLNLSGPRRSPILWRLSLFPLPAGWIGLSSAVTHLARSPVHAAIWISGLTVFWIAILCGTLAKARPAEENIGFAADFACWTNCLYLCFLPLAHA
jgi:hypothetical protein